jgi:hypothetical protein
MAIRKWHSGKLIILWAWGVVPAAVALTLFLSGHVMDTPVNHLLELAFALVILLLLSGITWYWLGGKESTEK